MNRKKVAKWLAAAGSLADGDGICRRTGRAAGNCGNGKRQLVRYAGDRADVSRSCKYFKAGSGDQECER